MTRRDAILLPAAAAAVGASPLSAVAQTTNLEINDSVRANWKRGNFNLNIVHHIWNAKAKFTTRDGKPAIIGPRPIAFLANFWAYWCPNCIAEFSDMKKMEEKFTVGNDINIFIVLISLPDDWEKDKAFADSHNIKFPLWRYEGNLSLEDFNYGLMGMPVEPGAPQAQSGLPVSFLYARGGKGMQPFRGGQDWLTDGVFSLVQKAVNA